MSVLDNSLFGLQRRNDRIMRVSGGVEAVDPATLSSLTLHVIGDQAFTEYGDGNLPGPWNDQSGAGNNLAVAGGSPAVNSSGGTNGHAAIELTSASSEYLQASGYLPLNTSGAGGAIFVVARATTGGQDYIITTRAGGNNNGWGILTADTDRLIYSLVGHTNTYDKTDYEDEWFVLGVRRNGLAHEHAYNSTEADGPVAASGYTVSAATGLVVGARSVPDLFFTGGIQEIAIAEALPTPDDFAGVMQHLIDKYALGA